MKIRAVLHGCWRKAHEESDTKKGDKGFFGGSRPCTSPSGESSSQNRQDVWDADLRVGKWESGGEETVSFLPLPSWLLSQYGSPRR